jgi:hypothetical protein
MLKNSPWWLALIQGLVALGAGLYLLVDPTGAKFLIGLLAALYLLVTGLIYTVRGIIARRPGKSSLLLIRGIVGLVVGGVLLLMALFDIGNLSLGYTILAIGLILFGGMGPVRQPVPARGQGVCLGAGGCQRRAAGLGPHRPFLPLHRRPADHQRLDPGAHRRGDHRLHPIGAQGSRQRSGLSAHPAHRHTTSPALFAGLIACKPVSVHGDIKLR